MRALLEKWAALEPERCWTDERGVAVHLGGQGCNYYGGPTSKAVILAATIEAIEAKGFGWALVSAEDGTEVNAAVQMDGDFSEAIDFSPAEALLTAYLAALEAAGTTIPPTV